MKNYFYLLLFFLISIQINLAQTFVSTNPENKKALVEKYTGINCSYCPCGDVIIYGAVENNPENIIVVKIHEGGYAVPGAGQPDFRTAFGSALSSQAMNTGNPAVSVNRHFFQNYTSNGGTAIGGCYSNATGVAMQSPPTYATDEILVEPAYLNVAAQAEINYSSNMLTVNTEVYYTDDSPTSTNYLNIALVQDNTAAYQAGSSLAAGGSNYVHNDRLVHFITGQWGEEINPTGQGSLIQTTHSYNIPENYNGIPVVLDDLKVVVFVSESTEEIINVNRAEMDYNTLGYDLSVDSIDSPVLAGNLSENENITVSISNNGDNNTSNFEISYSVDGTSISTESYTETISSGETVQFTFGATYDFSEVGDYNLSISVSLNEDENESNNTISELITNVGGGECPDEYGPPIIWRESFECYDPFIFEGIGDWIIYDLDGLASYGSNAMDFPTETYSGAAFIYNQALATVSSDNTNPQEPGWWNTYEGNQGLYFVSGVPSSLATQNNDWMISPEFSLDNIESPTLRFMAKTLKDDWGLERFKVAIGNSTNYNEFTVISEGTYLEAPTDWTLYEFDLSSYVGQNVRIGINYISDDKFVLQMDEFVVEGTLGINDDNLLEMILYPNPTDKNFVTIQTNSLDTKEIEVFDIIGKKVIDVSLNTNSLDVSKLNSGIYLVKITVDNQTNTHKLVIK
tara:strand:+ start:15769 stop:17823 length:2055 start_codon:yes stop_codon:yes gene_type:complete